MWLMINCYTVIHHQFQALRNLYTLWAKGAMDPSSAANNRTWCDSTSSSKCSGSFLGTALNRLSLLDFQPNHSFLLFFSFSLICHRGRGRWVRSSSREGRTIHQRMSTLWSLVAPRPELEIKNPWGHHHKSNRWIPLREKKTTTEFVSSIFW